MSDRSTGSPESNVSTPSFCPRCEAPFACGASVFGCWCFDYQLTNEMRQFIQDRFRGCLCPRCLEHFSLIGK